MMKFLTSILTFIVAIFLIVTVGNFLLDEYPGLQPAWEETKEAFANLYDKSVVKYGTGITVLLILGIGLMLATSSK